MISDNNIRKYNISELQSLFIEMGEKPFRAKQIYRWLWKKDASSFDEMTDLPEPFRKGMKEKFIINKLTIDKKQVSSDGTIKNAFRLSDGNFVEGVLIPTSHRTTACISSQVGCSLDCNFCATGRLKRMRNLDADEIYDQVVEINKQSEEIYGRKLSNIVYMGMGEPLLNYKNVLRSVEMITSADGLEMSPRRITLSTSGITKMIKKLADDNLKCNLAVSLHAADDEKRSSIMPINNTNNLEMLAESLRYFHDKTGTRVTFEYILFRNLNDSIIDADHLAQFCKNIPCKVNIIEYNPVEGDDFQKADEEQMNLFAGYLKKRNIIVNVRKSRGSDIDAACGQLANKIKQ